MTTGDRPLSDGEMTALGLTADASGRERLERAVRARSNGDPRTIRELLKGPKRRARKPCRSDVLLA